MKFINIKKIRQSPRNWTSIGIITIASLMVYQPPVFGANWLLVQGTEAPGRAPSPRFTGFLQADYQLDSSPSSPAGTYIPAKLISPDLTEQSAFTMRRIRLGTRGRLENAPVNYLFFAEFGENAITEAHNRPEVIDASISVAMSKRQWLRAGLFKTPGSEEGLQAIHVADYVNLSTVGNQLVLERPPNRHYSTNIAPLNINNVNHSLNGFDDPIAAFRDVGIEWFGVYKPGQWEHSYAVMIGNGNGLSFADDDGHKDVYLYFATEKVTQGKGGRRQGLKFYAWTQQGHRNYDSDNNGSEETYARDRSGIGAVWREKPWRVSGEYIVGRGMIFLGPDKPGFDINGQAAAGGDGLNGRSDGGYVEAGWYIPNSAWELDLRYDRYTRLRNDPFETRFEAITVGTQYHFNSNTHITLNLMNNDFRAVRFDSGAGPNAHLEGVDQRWAISLFTAF